MKYAAAILLALVASPCVAQDKPAGETLYKQKCAACHQPTGLGVKGAFPALAGDAIVLGDPTPLAARVLAGRGGMPTFKQSLNDQQLADVLSFIRASFGNGAGPVAPDIVAAARATLAAAGAAQGPRGN